jgi:Aromatic amino acid lyase
MRTSDASSAAPDRSQGVAGTRVRARLLVPNSLQNACSQLGASASTNPTSLQMRHITLDGSSLRIRRHSLRPRSTSGRPKVRLSGAAATRVEASNRLKHELLRGQIPIYGVTTGFGDSCIRQVDMTRAAALQRNLILYHLNGTGRVATEDVTGATMLIRANCLAVGASGVRVSVVEAAKASCVIGGRSARSRKRFAWRISAR